MADRITAIQGEQRMAPQKLRKALIGTLTAAALGLGTVAGATAATAAPVQQVPARTAIAQAAAYQNFGLNTAEAKSVQCYVRDAGYNPGTIDGQLGTNSWKAWQGFLNALGYNAGTVDGDPGPNTIKALQRFLNYVGYDTGGVDGDFGSKTTAAWIAFSNLGGGWC
jgi:peptidoglycan hydrolase-like protein with peptidoglycan-binding domain